jgi:DNA-binding MarR family transcriptional regulator
MIKLTRNDELVLYGLARWPDLNDEELSAKIDVKRSTVTAIRNKLARDGVYTRHNVPDLERIGCELLVASYCDFSPLTPWSKREAYVSEDPELFYRISTDASRLSIVAAENFTEVKRYLDSVTSRHATHGFLFSEGVRYVYFPFALSSLIMFYNFARLLNKRFELGFDDDSVPDLAPKKRRVRLSDTEKQALYIMVEYPRANDRDIAEKISVTRQTVNNVRRRMISEGLLKTVVFPDLAKLGFELIAFTHADIYPGVTLDKRWDNAMEVVREGSQYLIVSGNTESIMLSAFGNYTDFERTHEEILGLYSKSNFLARAPTIKIYPKNDIRNHMKLRCGPLVKKVLGINNV